MLAIRSGYNIIGIRQKKKKEGKSVKSVMLQSGIIIRIQTSESTEHFLPEIVLIHIYFLSTLFKFHLF
jgi:hypothetical protein